MPGDEGTSRLVRMDVRGSRGRALRYARDEDRQALCRPVLGGERRQQDRGQRETARRRSRRWRDSLAASRREVRRPGGRVQQRLERSPREYGGWYRTWRRLRCGRRGHACARPLYGGLLLLHAGLDSGFQRQAGDEAAAGAAQELERAAVRARDALDDREAEARAACAGARVVQPREGPLHALDFGRRDAGTAVAHFDRRAFGHAPRLDLDGLARVAQGVVDQVRDGAAHRHAGEAELDLPIGAHPYVFLQALIVFAELANQRVE